MSAVTTIKKNLKVVDMIETVKEFCGSNSIAYMNILQYSKAEPYQVTLIFEAIMQRELQCLEQDIKVKTQELQQMQHKVEKLKKMGFKR